MHLSWNEIRARAAGFAQEWKDAKYEKGETQSFYNDFFQVFGVSRRRVASYEEPVRLLGKRRGFIDLFWKGTLLVEQKSAGRDLIRAKQQALEYFPGLKESELPRYILVSDFQNFELHDLDEGTKPVKFKLSQLENVAAVHIGIAKGSNHDERNKCEKNRASGRDTGWRREPCANTYDPARHTRRRRCRGAGLCFARDEAGTLYRLLRLLDRNSRDVRSGRCGPRNSSGDRS